MVRTIEKPLCFKTTTHIAHFIRKFFFYKKSIAVRGDLGPKSGAQKYPKYAKSDVFLNFVDEIGNIAITIDSNIDKYKFLDQTYENKKISDRFTEIISKIGENILLGDLIILEHKGANIAYYVHNAYRSNSGKIISLVHYSSKKLDSY